ncbi:MAG: radical SAM protein [Candidatus Omnitrophica bacterium]|nr:radical SAM protein [Candidatus Omnitrophota bacterium]
MDRRVNAQLNQQEYCEHKTVLRSYPTIINLQTNNNCNARCVYCEIHGLNKKSFQYGTMPLELIKNNIFLFTRAKYVEFSVTGEPFLYPYLGELIEILAPLGIEFFLTTNGIDIDEKILFKLLPCTRSITISVDGPKTNELTRGYPFSKIVPTLERLREYKNVYGFNLNLSAVVTKKNLDDSLRLFEVGAKYHCKNLIYTKVLFLKEELRDEYLPSYGEFVDFLDALERFRKMHPALTVVNTLQKVADWHCPVLWKNLYLFPNGDVLGCCMNNDLMGNITQSSFEDIWNNQKYVEMRSRYREICSNCMHVLLSKHSYREIYDVI